MVDQKTKLKQQDAAPKRAEKTTMDPQKCETEKKFQHLCRTESINV